MLPAKKEVPKNWDANHQICLGEDPRMGGAPDCNYLKPGGGLSPPQNLVEIKETNNCVHSMIEHNTPNQKKQLLFLLFFWGGTL